MNWMSSNLTHEGMIKTIKDMKKLSKTKNSKKKTKEEIGNEWMRLASFQQRQ